MNSEALGGKGSRLPGESKRAQDTDARGSASDRRAFDDICGDFGISIRRDGTWFYRGSPIGRMALVKLFASVLRRDETGSYWLVTPAEKGRIVVEDVPFVAVEASVNGSGREQIVTLRTNLDEIVTLDREHPLRVEEVGADKQPIPYVLVRDRLEARLARSVFYHLVAHGDEQFSSGKRMFGIWSRGDFFPLGELELDAVPGSSTRSRHVQP